MAARMEGFARVMGYLSSRSGLRTLPWLGIFADLQGDTPSALCLAVSLSVCLPAGLP